MNEQAFRTVPAPAEYEIARIKGSRFLGFVWPVRNEEEAMTQVDALRRRYHDARHCCWAWRVGRDAELFRYQDDGEPKGSAGRPILTEIEGAELTDVLVVVVRYFGGIKLGRGNLARAYAEAARATLDRAGSRAIHVHRSVTVRFGYEDTAAIQALMRRFAQNPVEAHYKESTTLQFSLPSVQAEPFAASLLEATSGRAKVDIGPEEPFSGP